MPPRVLLVDDEPVLLRTARRALGGLFDLDTVGSAEEALQLLARESYDVLVTDNLLPGMTGLELIDRARSLDETLPCVLVTGSIEHAELLDVRRFHTLFKPYDRVSLVGAIERALSQVQRTRARQRRSAYGSSPRKAS